MLYTEISDASVAHLVSQKINRLRRNHSKGGASNTNGMPLIDWINLFKRGSGLCYYSGKDFENLEDITFERINPLKSYCKGNVVLVKSAFNNSKSKVDQMIHECNSEEIAIRILSETIKHLRKSVKEKKKLREKHIQEVQQRVSNLSEMTSQMMNAKRSRFSFGPQ